MFSNGSRCVYFIEFIIPIFIKEKINQGIINYKKMTYKNYNFI